MSQSRGPLFTVEEVLEITSGHRLSGTERRARAPGIRRLCTDSREVRAGDLFIALQGERFDGHEFVPDALRRHAVGAVVQSQYRLPRDKPGRGPAPLLIGVGDPLTAFQQLASHHRSRFGIPVVAVTGSNGKTTTKDMVAAVLAERWRTLKTEGNLNNRIGVPMTLLRLMPRHEAAVIEMGVDAKGQTARLCETARPTVGIITNIGPDHLEFFGTLDASADAKGELLDHLPEDGAAVLNADDAYFTYLASRARCRVVSFGFSKTAQVRGEPVAEAGGRGAGLRLWLPGQSQPSVAHLLIQGRHNLANALAAAAVGYVLGMSGAAIARGLARFRPADMRSQVVQRKGITIINDCYNANPASMKAALDLLKEVGNGHRTVAVLGDMLELGPAATELHREVGAHAAARGLACLVACGGLGQGIAEGARAAGMSAAQVREAHDAAEAAAFVKSIIRAGDVVLVKGSRGMKMERVVDALTKR
jgi:UDP-N-acetylmuramoyl-tripeptide--D-alanyl-D-alanine ligase